MQCIRKQAYDSDRCCASFLSPSFSLCLSLHPPPPCVSRAHTHTHSLSLTLLFSLLRALSRLPILRYLSLSLSLALFLPYRRRAVSHSRLQHVGVLFSLSRLLACARAALSLTEGRCANLHKRKQSAGLSRARVRALSCVLSLARFSSTISCSFSVIDAVLSLTATCNTQDFLSRSMSPSRWGARTRFFSLLQTLRYLAQQPAPRRNLVQYPSLSLARSRALSLFD